LRGFQIFISVAQKPKSGLGRLALRFTNRNFAHTLGSTPMNEWSALHRGRSHTKHNKHDESPRPQRDSKSRSQRPSGRNPKP